MTRTTRMLLAAAASVAIAGASSNAMAFDGVEWNWKKWIWEDWDIDVDVKADFKADTIVEIEKLQIAFGDHEAYAKVEDITNDPFGDQKGDVHHKPPRHPKVAVHDKRKGQKPFPWYDPRPRLPKLKLSALPKIENIATAVANNQTIEVSATGTAALFLHDAQIAAGDIKPIEPKYHCDYNHQTRKQECREIPVNTALIEALEEMGNDSGGHRDLDNFHHDLAGLVLLGALLGVIDEAEIKAEAYVQDIKNATVENVATAVGNNASFTLEALSPADEENGEGYFSDFWKKGDKDRDVKVDARAVMVADVTQLLIGDTEAKAVTKDVKIEGYDLAGINTHMVDGELSGNVRPIISNVATAVGNNLNIKVTACGTCGE